MGLKATPAFEEALGPLVSPAVKALRAQLSHLDNLESEDRRLIVDAASRSLSLALHRRLSRLLVVELNLARVEKRLDGETSEARWDDFLRRSARPAFWDALAPQYPNLASHTGRLVRNAAEAALAFARHWADDRDALAPLLGGRPPGRLTQVDFGAGDSHHGGRTVAMVGCDGGQLVYKPRSLGAEVRLRDFLSGLAADLGRPLAASVAAALDRGDHGWSAFVAHALTASDAELRGFYQGVGQWLAIMRLLGGVDLHAENLIAHRGRPFVVDCEALFTPKVAPFASDFGEAFDRATRLMSGSVLATGLLPQRGQALAMRGVDVSGIGGLPGEQPRLSLPDVVGAGTDRARIERRLVEVPRAKNHPAAVPTLEAFWPDVLAGFDEISRLLRGLDRDGKLERRLAPFESVPIRVPVRSTEVYAEIGRMLWHPVSLHDEAAARGRARALLSKMAANVSIAPSDPEVIEAEIDELLAGDIPYFWALAGEGRLQGPCGTRWLAHDNLVEASLADWRSADLGLERSYIRNALICAYVTDRRETDAFRERRPGSGRADIDVRRRRQAAAIMESLAANAIWGGDGAVTWIAPTRTPSGWAVQPLGPDVYSGLSGVAILVAAYLAEVQAGRADPIGKLQPLLRALQLSLSKFEIKQIRDHDSAALVRPPAPGCYVGLGSQIWRLLLLDAWGFEEPGALRRAAELARGLPSAAAADEALDVLSGIAGAIPPLLELARRTGDAHLTEMAVGLGDRLVASAVWRDGCACWSAPNWPDGLGGFAHGVTGIGWALAALASISGDDRHRNAADGAFAFEDALWDEGDGGWTDLRMATDRRIAPSWCNGSTGIGLARLNRDPKLAGDGSERDVRRAVASTWRQGRLANLCACHGELGSWELFDRAARVGVSATGGSREAALADILAAMEDGGPDCGAAEAFVPSLMMGHGSIAYQLLRAHPESRAPSILTPQMSLEPTEPNSISSASPASCPGSRP